MKQFLLTTGILFSTGLTFGQGSAAEYADDAFRYSNFTQSGTARFRGLGGNQAALGGDASSTFGNPAGLAFYNRSEFSISPSLNLTSNQNNYLGSQSNSTKTNFNIGQLGIVFALGRTNNDSRYNNSTRWRRSTIGITYSQSVNFSNRMDVSGTNNNTNSSILQPYINGAQGLTPTQLNNAFDGTANQADYTEAAAYNLFLINPVDTTAGNSTYFRPDEDIASRNQRITTQKSGTHSQWTVAYAGNLDDKLYIGASIALTHLRYRYDYTLSEAPIGGIDFDNYGQVNHLDVNGNGINASLGVIYKIVPSFQVGLTLTTPTFSAVHETFTQSLYAYPKSQFLLNQYQLLGIQNTASVAPNDFDYRLTTPFRSSLGATYFINDGKVGFLTGTIEYVSYAGMRVGTSALGSSQTNSDFHDDVKSNVQETYKSVLNVRGGAEFRFGLLRVRGGVAYMPSAYKIDLDRVAASDRSTFLVSGGLGIRNDRFFLDGSVTYNTTKLGFSPYYLPNASDSPTVATTSNRTNLMVSIGTFF